MSPDKTPPHEQCLQIKHHAMNNVSRYKTPRHESDYSYSKCKTPHIESYIKQRGFRFRSWSLIPIFKEKEVNVGVFGCVEYGYHI
uniref:Uncharacterized protein n=1 Tax=Helianthus annuus TaxID=4232 RepID=A0A251SH15_HELAN